MYTKRILSAAAAVAVMTSGAMAFDMKKNGTIITDVTASTEVNASYVGGVDADANLSYSTNRQGDALIYPAFRSSDGWETEITVRNTKSVSVIAKAVLYAQKGSKELLDFNIYLSPHDAAVFTIKDGNVTSTDGSITYEVIDPSNGVKKDDAHFASKTHPFTAEFQDKSVGAGYVIVYGMTQEVNSTAIDDYESPYHNKTIGDQSGHLKLFKNYRKLLDVCRDTDHNITNPAGNNWRKIFSRVNGKAKNGTATELNVTAPTVDENCTIATDNNGTGFSGDYALDTNFTTPASDAFFGEVRISHAGDKRDMLLVATALSNYTTDNQMMLWAEGEYAAIQDRRINDNNTSTIADYNTTEIAYDSANLIVNNGYFTFKENAISGKNDYAFLVTQPTKRAMAMAGNGPTYWSGTIVPKKEQWGYFTLNKTNVYDNDEIGNAAKTVGFVSYTSPLDSDVADVAKYSKELATFSYEDMTKGYDDRFVNGEVSGYIDMQINGTKGLPAIITEMSSSDIDGEAQINWIYSATN